MNRKPMLILLGLTVLSFLQVWYFYPQLPETIAHHYNFTGQPDAWGSKDMFIRVHLGTVLFLTAIFIAIDRLITRVPDDLINLPHKEYWLAPERRRKTLQRLSDMSLWMGNITLIFMLLLFQYKYTRDLLERAHELKFIWMGLLIYFVTLSVWIWHSYRTFKAIPG